MNGTDQNENPDPGETSRLEALRQYAILDTPPEPAFDALASLTARVLDVPVALIAFVDENRIWFKSRHGLAGDSIEELERDPALCDAPIRDGVSFAVRDAREDSRLRSNALATGAVGMRFFAAAPLSTKEGKPLGMLCAIGKAPRDLEARERDILESLAGVVMDEVAMRQAALAGEAAREEDQHYLAQAVHDFRSPLSTITMYAGMLEIGDAAPLDAEQAKMLSGITRNCKFLATLVDQFLQYSSLGPDRLTLRKEPVNLRSLIDRCVDAAQVDPLDAPMLIEVRADDDLPEIELDAERIALAMSNVIENALRFSSQEAPVTIALRGWEAVAEVVITDGGSRERYGERDRAFEPFNSGFCGEGATGLELAIAKRLVDAHGGEIDAGTGEGPGTSFHIRFPAEVGSSARGGA